MPAKGSLGWPGRAASPVTFIGATGGAAGSTVLHTDAEVDDVALIAAAGGGAIGFPLGFLTVSASNVGGNFYGYGWKRITASDIASVLTVTNGTGVTAAVYRSVADPLFAPVTATSTGDNTGVVTPALTGQNPMARIIRLVMVASNFDGHVTSFSNGVLRVAGGTNTWSTGIGEERVKSDGTVLASTAVFQAAVSVWYTSVALVPRAS